MNMDGGQHIMQTLEHDYRQLALSSRKSDSIVSQFFSGSSSASQNDIKEASERAMLVLRGLQAAANPVADMKKSRGVLLKPVELSCQGLQPKLVQLALAILQKLISCHVLEKEDAQMCIHALTSVEKVQDESVQLKILQTSLVLLQSSIRPRHVESILSIVSLCFRAMTPRGKAQVTTTAAATVRQAVAIVLTYVDVEVETGRSLEEQDSSTNNLVTFQSGEVVEDDSLEGLKASQRLLEDLIALSSGSPARWIKTPSLPKTFSLEILDFALLSNPKLFLALPGFETSISLRIIQVLQSQLQDHIDAAASKSSLQNFAAFRAVLKCIRTVLLLYHSSIGVRCRSLIQILLKGVQSCQSLLHRVAICQTLRQLLGDPSLVMFLYVTFDSRKESQTDVVVAMVNVMTSTAETGLHGRGTYKDDNSSSKMDAVSQVYFSRDVSFDVEIEPSMPANLQSTAFIVISLNAVLRCMQTVSAIVAHCLGVPFSTEETAASPRFHQPTVPLGDVSRASCESLVCDTWEPLISSVTDILKDCAHEKLELELLESLQVFTEAIGKLHLREPMTACLESLCQIALSDVNQQDEISEDKVVLRSKNFQAMKTIFKIAQGLANDLGPAWQMVLEAMYSLDTILMDPKLMTTSADQKEASLDDLDRSSSIITMVEIEDLKNVMQDLFDSTKDMSREGAVSLLGGLRDVSMHHLPHAESMALPKMSALQRMVDVLLANSFRAYDLWGSFLSHVLELVGDSKQSIRESAIEALGRAITGILANLHVSSDRDSTGGLEHMLLVALEALHNDDKEIDVQVGVLKVLSSVLQRNGEHLTDGWTPVFRLLASVAEAARVETVSLGCESLQIVYNDYLDDMSNERIEKCLEMAELFGKQQADVNVSLTIISLFWNVGDMLGTRRADSMESSESHKDPFSTDTEHLLGVIYDALYKISQDSRPEVRNSGARTLFAMVSAHGNRLSKEMWKVCLWEMLFPLLRYSFHMSVTSSKDEAEAALLGKSKGEDVHLVVHHSRNTEQKQWDETVVVCLAGMSRLLRSHMQTISQMPGFEDGWSELMVVVESSLAGGRKEVALSAINLLSGLLGTHGTGITDSVWQRGLRAVDVGVVAATSGGCHVPLGARTELVIFVGSLYEANKARFDSQTTLQLYRWIDSFCRNPWSEDDAANPVQPVGMPPVQKTALGLLRKLQPDDEALWPDFLEAVVSLVEPEHAIALLGAEGSDTASSKSHKKQGSSETLPPPSLAQYRFALNAAFVEKVMDLLVSLFEEAPLSAKAAALPEIVSVLGRCMELRYSAYDHTLWRTAANVFLRLAPTGVMAIDAMNRATSASQDQSHADHVWHCLSEAFSHFLLGPSVHGTHQTPQKSKLPSTSETGDLQDAQKFNKENESIPEIPFLSGIKKRRGRRASSLEEAGKVEVEDKEETPPELPCVDDGRAKEDGDLELRVLDCLTDEILTACGTASQAAIDSLIHVVEEGISRPSKYQILQNVKHSNFSLVCIRKMYVLCSRGSNRTIGDAGGDTNEAMYEQVAQVRSHVAKCALPQFLKICHNMINNFAQESQYTPLGDTHVDRPKLEEIICILEVLATMTLAPDVVDSMMPENDPMGDYIRCMRKRPEVASRGKERTHLLFLYDSLCSLITCRDSRIRDMVRDVLVLAGAELGISMNALSRIL